MYLNVAKCLLNLFDHSNVFDYSWVCPHYVWTQQSHSSYIWIDSRLLFNVFDRSWVSANVCEFSGVSPAACEFSWVGVSMTARVLMSRAVWVPPQPDVAELGSVLMPSLELWALSSHTDWLLRAKLHISILPLIYQLLRSLSFSESDRERVEGEQDRERQNRNTVCLLTPQLQCSPTTLFHLLCCLFPSQGLV